MTFQDAIFVVVQLIGGDPGLYATVMPDKPGIYRWLRKDTGETIAMSMSQDGTWNVFKIAPNDIPQGLVCLSTVR